MPAKVGTLSADKFRMGAATPSSLYLGTSRVWPFHAPEVNGNTTPGSGRTIPFPSYHDFAAVLLIGGGGGGAGAGWVLNGNGGAAGTKAWMTATSTAYGTKICYLSRTGLGTAWLGYYQPDDYYIWFLPYSTESLTVTVGTAGSGGNGGALPGSGSAGGASSINYTSIPLYVNTGTDLYTSTGHTGNVSTSAAGGANNANSGTRDGTPVGATTLDIGGSYFGGPTTLTLHAAASQGQTPGAGGRGGSAVAGNGTAGGAGGVYIASMVSRTVINSRRA